MTLLYVCNLVAALALTLWPLWFSTRFLHLPAINPFTIVMAMDLPIQLMKLYAGPYILLDDGLFDLGYQYAMLMGNLLVVSQTLGLLFFYRWFSRSRVERLVPFQKIVLGPNDLRRAAWFFLVLFAFAFYMLASAEFGLLNWLANPRLGYQLYRLGQGHWYALAISALGISMVLSFLANLSPRAVFLSTPLYLGLSYLLGSKTILLMIFGALIIFLWFIRWKHLLRMLLIGTPLVFALMTWNLYLALADQFELLAIFEYFDYYVRGADYYREVLDGRVGLFHGEVMLTSLWSYVPRAIWPDKPFVYGVVLINEIFFPGQAELTSTPAFSGAVEQYADFGEIGVVVLGFFSSLSISTALISRFLFRRPGLDLRRMSLGGIAIFIVQYAPAFGTFFPGALYLLLLAAVIFAIWCFRSPPRRAGASMPLPNA